MQPKIKVPADRKKEIGDHVRACMVSARKNDLENYTKPKSDREEFENKCTGFIGEVAASMWLNLKWNKQVLTVEQAINKQLQDPDIGFNIEVRTKRKPSHRLYLKPSDNPDRIFLSMYYNVARDYLQPVGWIYGREAFRKDWLTYEKGKKVYYVPNSHLKDPDQLILQLEGKR